MKTLFPAIRVGDLDASLCFYRSVGYDVVGTVAISVGTRLAMLALPEGAEVSLELVHRPADGPVSPRGLDHLTVQVDDLAVARELLMARGLEPGEVNTPGGADGPARRGSPTQTVTVSSSCSGPTVIGWDDPQ